jgi:hypothetical protein
VYGDIEAKIEKMVVDIHELDVRGDVAKDYFGIYGLF